MYVCYKGLAHTLLYSSILLSFIRLTIRFHILHPFPFSQQLFYLSRLSVRVRGPPVLNYSLCPADHLCSVTRTFAWMHMCIFTTMAMFVISTWLELRMFCSHTFFFCSTWIKSSNPVHTYNTTDERYGDLCFQTAQFACTCSEKAHAPSVYSWADPLMNLGLFLIRPQAIFKSCKVQFTDLLYPFGSRLRTSNYSDMKQTYKKSPNWSFLWHVLTSCDIIHE